MSDLDALTDDAADELAHLIDEVEEELDRPLDDDERESVAEEFLAGLDDDDEGDD